MQLLLEELLRKAFATINQLNILIRSFVKLLFYAAILSFFIFLIKMIHTGNYLPVGIILALYVLGESSHYIRKTREKVMAEIAEEDNMNKPKKIRPDKKSLNTNLLEIKKK